MSKLKKVIIITGGSEGLGRAMAERLAKANSVIILARNEKELKQAASEIGCDWLVCDVTQHDQITRTVAKILKKYRRIDALINNAGLWMTGELTANNPDKIRGLLDVNTLGTILFSRAVTPVMKEQKTGLIINIVSDAGLKPKAERTVYQASKYAITGFTKSLELEVAKYGIAVTGIYPSKIKTRIFAKAGVDMDLDDAIDPAEIARAIEFVVSVKPPNLIPHLEIRHFPRA